MTPPPAEAPRVQWALDLDPGGWPVLAHKITATEAAGTPREVRVTACGQRLTAANHPRGWWSFPPGELPLSGPNDIHCGTAEEPAGDT